MPVVKSLDETAEVARLDFTAEEDICADVEIVGEREVLVDRLDARAARLHRTCELNRLAVEDDLAVFRRVDSGDAFDKRRLARAVVAEQADHLAGRDVETHVVDGDEAAEHFREAADGEQRRTHRKAPAPARPVMRSRD